MPIYNIDYGEITLGETTSIAPHPFAQLRIAQQGIQPYGKRIGIVYTYKIAIISLLDCISATDRVGGHNGATDSISLDERLGQPLSIIGREGHNVRLTK